MKTNLGRLDEALSILDELTDELFDNDKALEKVQKAMAAICIAKHKIKTAKEVKLKRAEVSFIKRMLDHWIESADTRYLFAKTAEQKRRISETNDIAILASDKIGRILK